MISRSIFRAYDIRGEVDKNFTPEVVYVTGRAIASEALSQGENTVLVGRDGRLSGPDLSCALVEGLQASGCNVIDLGRVPTPVLYFATHTLNTRSGVMLTGSHNPPNYNGLKVVVAGKVLAESAIQALHKRIMAGNLKKGQGGYETYNIIPHYLKRIQIDIRLNKKLKVVVDCGNGVPGLVAPILFQTLGCEVIPLFCEVDGHFPNHHPDPIDPNNLQELIKTVCELQADLGLAFDGDGDRLGVVTNKGTIVWADRQMMLFAIDLLSRHPGAEILFDVKCTQYLSKIIEKYGGHAYMWKTGHSLIKAKMAEKNVLLAGEMSGHIFFKERWYGFDDGLYAAARLLEILSQQNESADVVFSKLPTGVVTPELRLSMPEDKKFSFVEALKTQAKFSQGEVSTIDGLRVNFDDGWGLVRCSNTTPYVILRFEGDNEESLERIQEQFRQQLLKLDPHLTLPF